MKPFAALLLVAGIALPAAAGDDAEEAHKLYQGMWEKVAAAKTLRVRFDVALTDALGGTGTVAGTLTLGDGQKYRAEAAGKVFGQAVKFTGGSDGATAGAGGAAGRNGDGGGPAIKDAGTYLRAALARDGFLLGTLNMKERSTWPADRFKLSEFELGGTERVNGRDARVVRYKLGIDGGGDPLAVRVWLDAGSGLPARLEATGGRSDIRVVTETYTEFAIDPKVDARTFDLPK